MAVRSSGVVAWDKQIRAEARRVLPPGFNVAGDKTGKARLQQRTRDEAGKVTSVSVSLPYPWKQENNLDLCMRLREIAKRLHAGATLKEATTEVHASSSAARYDWPAIAIAFETYKRHHDSGVSESTWVRKYAPVINLMLKLLNSPAGPGDATTLLELATRHWDLGSRSRQIGVQSGSAFLRFAVERHGVSARSWLPLANTKSIIGRLQPKREQFALDDAQVIRLVEGLQAIGTEETDRWTWAVQLCATFGLRPCEIFYLRFRGDDLWCEYRKKGGGGDTKPRRLYAAPVMDGKSAVDWKVIERLRASECLPQVASPSQTGDRMGRFLRRQSIWRELCLEAEARGYELVPYSLRHRYSRACHGSGITVKMISDAMGHSLEVHQRVYARFDSSADAADAFERAFQQF